MSDLIERLRGLNAEHQPFGAAHEAADELERLTAERNAFQDQCDALKQEMTVMREERDIDEQRVADLMTQVAEIAAERDMLVEALKKARDNIADWGAYASPYFQDKWNLEGDIKAADEALAKVGADKTGEK